MKKLTPAERKALSEMSARLKALQSELTEAKKREGLDAYVTIKVKDRQARFERTRTPDGPDKAVGRYLLFIDITAKQVPVLVPLSVASSKSVSGFMYHIEGTGEAAIATADVTARGQGLTQVGIGTLQLAKIAPGQTATFRVDIIIRGKIGKKYQIVVNRINYKLALTNARYQQYLKPIVSKGLRFA
jgi:hypothetical protein